MPSYLLLDGANKILEAYNGPAAGASPGAIAVADALYFQLPVALAGWVYVPPEGETPAAVAAPPTPQSP